MTGRPPRSSGGNGASGVHPGPGRGVSVSLAGEMRRNIHRDFSFVYPDGESVSPCNGAIVVPVGTIPAGSGIFRGNEKSPHRAGGDEQDPLFRLFLGDRGGHDVRGAPLPDGRGEGSSPRAPRSPVARLLPVRRARLLFGDGGDAGDRQVILPERVLAAPPRNRLPVSAVEAPRGDAGARHRRFRAARGGRGEGPRDDEGEGALPRGGGDRRHRGHRLRLLPLRSYRRPGSLLLPASRRVRPGVVVPREDPGAGPGDAFAAHRRRVAVRGGGRGTGDPHGRGASSGLRGLLRAASRDGRSRGRDRCGAQGDPRAGQHPPGGGGRDCRRLAGALDVPALPAMMKKNRPGWVLRILCPEERLEIVSAAVFSLSTAIGLRYHACDRLKLARRSGTVETRFGKVRIKEAELPDGSIRPVPEYDDVRRIVRAGKASFEEVAWEVARKWRR